MINSSTLFVTVFLVILTLVVPRKFFLIPYIIAACFVPRDQRLVITTLDFNVLRILLVAGVLRILLRGEQRIIRWNVFDKVFLAWAICGAITYIIQWADIRAFIFQCGVLFDLVGFYWLFRQNIRSWGDIYFVGKAFSLCVLVMAPLVAIEWKTGENPFRILGQVITYERQGRYRCQASFPISILMGLFWATLVPLFVGMAMMEKKKLIYWSAIAASIFLVIASASATPLITLFLVLLILCAFRWRRYTRQAFLTLFLSLIALHIVMDAPVWHLISRINVVSGSSAWHRYHIIDETIKHYNEWILCGVRSSRHWGFLTGDMANQYLIEAVQGGIITFGLFITMLVIGFNTLIKCFEKSRNHKQQLFAWCLLICMIGHCIAFLGVSYFGQIMMLWYLMLSIIGFLADKSILSNPVDYEPLLNIPDYMVRSACHNNAQSEHRK